MVLVVAVLTFFPFHIPFYRDVYNNVVLDNYDHWLPCSKLPTLEQVEAVMARHEDALARIRAVEPTPGVYILVDSHTCEGHADIVIEYGGHSQREHIEKLLDNRTFFGIPVRLRNI